MKHRHDRFAVVLVLTGVIAVAPVFTAAAERQTGATTTQPAPAAPPAAATQKTPAAPPPLPAALAVQIKLQCDVDLKSSGLAYTTTVYNTTSKTLPAGQRISWRLLRFSGSKILQPGPIEIYTLLVPLQPGAHTAMASVPIGPLKIISCEAFLGG